MKLDFDPGFDITPLSVDEGFRLGADCFDKGTEFRKLDSVRKSLRDPNCDGPENVYAIMMDVGARRTCPPCAADAPLWRRDVCRRAVGR